MFASSRGYDERDPRPPSLRALDLAAALAEQYEAVGIELSLGTQATDRMVGEPTTFPKAWFDAFPHAQDATPLLAEKRAVKTPQEIERMRLANEIAAAAMEHVQGVLRPGMTRGAGCLRVARLRPRRGHGLGREGRPRARLLARLVGRGDPHVHGHHGPAGGGGRADPVRDLGLRRRLLVRPHEEPRPRRAHGPLPGARGGPARRLRGRGRVLRPGSEPARARPEDPGGDRGDSGSRASRATRSATGSARAPTSRRTRTRPAGAPWRREWCSRSSPGATSTDGGGLRVEDNFLITETGPEKLSTFPDGIVQA